MAKNDVGQKLARAMRMRFLRESLTSFTLIIGIAALFLAVAAWVASMKPVGQYEGMVIGSMLHQYEDGSRSMHYAVKLADGHQISVSQSLPSWVYTNGDKIRLTEHLNHFGGKTYRIRKWSQSNRSRQD